MTDGETMMTEVKRSWVEWSPAAMSAVSVVAFLLLLCAFYISVMTFRVSIVTDAHRDLESRAKLAAKTLEEPLRTLDFATVRAFGEDGRKRGYELSVTTGGRGLVFDTRRENRGDSTEHWVASGARCGEFEITLMRAREDVLSPFRRLYRLFVLAALVGASGMFAVFFVLYRQRVRIRELAKLERFRREFVADVSHELKTPLTGILGAVDMLDGIAAEQGDGGGQGGVLLALIKKESKRLNALVQSILDLARLEREGEVLERAEFDLAELLQELATQYGVRYDGSGGREQLVVGDASLILQAVANLIENAQRHSGTDDIALSLTRGDGWTHILVEDHGVGIPPEHAERIFDRFHRVDPARSAETGGAGLGLAIVRRIARLHGGDVTLTPASPHGCRFDLAIPD